MGVYPPLLGVYPSSLALADYWSHLVWFTLEACLGRLLESFGSGVSPLGWGLPSKLVPGETIRGLAPKWAPPHVSGQRGKPSNTFNNEFDRFLAGVEIGFLASTWGLPPGLALADYWSHLVLGFTPLVGVYPPSLCLGLTARACLGFTLSCLGFTPLAGLRLGSTARGLPPKWAPPHVSGQRGKPSNTFNNEFDLFLAGVETGFLAST